MRRRHARGVSVPSLALAIVLTWSSGDAWAAEDAESPTSSEGLLAEFNRYAIPEEPALTVNEPMYFVLGRDDGETTARFQFSFQYQIFAADEAPMPYGFRWLEPLHFAYTQTSLWNLSQESEPFEDSSYRPSFFWEFARTGDNPGIGPDFLRFGYEHESNGQDGDTSRSIDTLFLLPAWRIGSEARELVLIPKLYAYVSKGDENADIEEFRGYGDFIIRYGNDNGALAQLLYRRGNRARDSIQLDLSWPLRTAIAARTGGFFHAQLFQGFGESLLRYNQKQDLQFRVGFSIVR